MLSARVIICTGVLINLTAVCIGAFGAHGLAELLESHQRVDVYDLANRYQFYHGFALIVTGLFARSHAPSLLVAWSALLMFIGILVFCGSLYTLALTNIGILGAITPIGGVFLIVAWSLLVVAVLREPIATNEAGR